MARQSIAALYESFKGGKGRIVRRVDEFPLAIAFLVRYCSDLKSALRTYGDDTSPAPSIRSVVRERLQGQAALALGGKWTSKSLERIRRKIEKLVAHLPDTPRKIGPLRSELVHNVLKSVAAIRADPDEVDWFPFQRVLARQRDKLLAAAGVRDPSNEHPNDRVRLAWEIESVLLPVAWAFEEPERFFNLGAPRLDPPSFEPSRLRSRRALKKTLAKWGPLALHNKAVKGAFEALPPAWRDKARRSSRRDRRRYVSPRLPPKPLKGVPRPGRPRMPEASVEAIKKRAYRARQGGAPKSKAMR